MVVTRYFGGIKLGFGGLSRAYRETAISAIEEAGTVEVFEEVRFRIRLGYPEIQKIKNSDRGIRKNRRRKILGYRRIYYSYKKGVLKKNFIEKLVKLTKNKVELEKI